MAEAIGAKRFPVNVLVGPDGVVREVLQGWGEEHEPRLRAHFGLD